jgi:hypothetical protein
MSTDRILAISLGLASIILPWILPIWWPSLPKKWARIGFGVGVVLVGVAFGTLLLPADAPAQNTFNAPNNSGIITNGQTGGTNTIINQQPPKLTFTDALGTELLAKLRKDELVAIHAVGSPSDIAVGVRIADFLKANGYKVDVTAFGVLVPPPDDPLTLEVRNSVQYLTVAPAVR